MPDETTETTESTSTETTASTEGGAEAQPEKKKNKPRHITMMDREFDRLSSKLESAIIEFANVSRARAILAGGKVEDATVVASVTELATTVLAEQAENQESDGN